MSWCFVTQTVFSLDLDGTCTATLHEMATLFQKHHTKTQSASSRDAMIPLEKKTSPSKCILQKRKKYFKKMKQSRRGIPMCQPTETEVFYILVLSFQEQYKVLINKRVADKKKRQKYNRQSQWKRRFGLNLLAEKQFHGAAFVPKIFLDLFRHCSLFSKFPPHALFCVAK